MVKPNFEESLQIFGLESLSGQTEDSLKKVYHELANKYHPDREGGSVRQFIRLREAYSILKMRLDDPSWRDYKPGNSKKSSPDSEAYEQEFRQKETRQSHINWQAEAERLRRELEIYKDAYEKHSQRIFRYENLFNLQINLVNETQGKINREVEKYKSQVAELQKWLDDNLGKANQRYERKWWQYIIPVKKLNQQEYISLHNAYVNEFNKNMTQLEKEFTENLLRAYKTSMDQTLNLFEL